MMIVAVPRLPLTCGKVNAVVVVLDLVVAATIKTAGITKWMMTEWNRDNALIDHTHSLLYTAPDTRVLPSQQS